MQWSPPDPNDETDQHDAGPWDDYSRRHWWVRWRWAERAFIAAAVVVSFCVITLALASCAWLLYQIWRLRFGG